MAFTKCNSIGSNEKIHFSISSNPVDPGTTRVYINIKNDKGERIYYEAFTITNGISIGEQTREIIF